MNYQSQISGDFHSISLYDNDIVVVTQEGVHYWNITREEWSMEEVENFSNEPLIGKYLENGTLMDW